MSHTAVCAAPAMPLIMPASVPAQPPTMPQEDSPPAVVLATPTIRPQAVSVALPHIIHTTLHIQVTRFGTSNMVFITTSDPSSSLSSSALGSFVYAMPNVCIYRPLFNCRGITYLPSSSVSNLLNLYVPPFTPSQEPSTSHRGSPRS